MLLLILLGSRHWRPLQGMPSSPRLSCAAQGTKDFITNMGLGMIADQLADLKLGELLDTPPPGLDEAVAIAKVGPVHCHVPSAPGTPAMPGLSHC